MISDRIDAITTIDKAHYGTIIPAPKSVKIELTGRCNFNCTFCARSQNLRKTEDIDPVFFQRILKEMREDGVEEIGMFYLGESFMVKWLPEAIKYAKDIGFPYVFLTTNGSLVNEKNAKACMEAGLDSLKFSFNYADEDQMFEIARVKKSYYQRVIRNIKSARKVRDEGHYKCGLYASYIEYDGEQRKKMMDAIKEIEPYLDEVYALPLYGQAGPQESPSEASGMKPTGGNTGRADHPVPPLPCWAILQEGHITWDGKLSACCWDHNDGLTMGDLTKDKFMDAWNSDKFQRLRAAHLSHNVVDTSCRKCIYGTA